MSDEENKRLGMDRAIPRRDFIGGVATGLVGMAVCRAFAQPTAESLGLEPAVDITGG
jgi:hypothetical protein